jgi:hypothetical protein
MITLPWVYGLETTTCRYKGLLQEYVMLCYGLPNKWSPLAVLRFPTQTFPLCTMWFRQVTNYATKYDAIPTQPSMTQPIAYLISKEVVPYRTRGSTCCHEVSTPKIRYTILSIAQTIASIPTKVNSHLDEWKTISHKGTSQTQQHKG